ncbi:Putative Transcription factor [Penicillium brasilianum]|uniref:Putative Transcription factor n=1 Tax=Penicillium brasilianum TaxID=104259 RepID=A0A0F7TEF1_PENBI|nr:Putative Transcription factor [Penicillium brasilianum]
MKEDLDLEDGPGSAAIASIDLGQSIEPTVKHSGPRRAPKRRVKTGCLTCRKRRIKCGEEKPICSNCVKSKRICEGYARQVVFKNPLGLFGSYGPPPGQDQMQKQHMRVPLYNEFGALPAQHAAAAAQHPMLAPRPIDPATMGYQSFQTYETTQPVDGQGSANAPQFYYPALPTHIPPQTWSAQPPPQHPQEPSPSGTSDYAQVQSQQSSSPSEPVQPHGSRSQHPQPIIYWSNVQQGQEFVPASLQLPPGGAQAEDGPENPLFPQPLHSTEAVFQYQQPGQVPLQLDPPGQYAQQYQQQIVYVEEEDEEYYDVESDEEMVDQTQVEGFNQLSLIMASANHDDRQLRSFTTHLNEPNILASYNPSLGSSPLNNPKTARIFAHFIHSTGPSLSIFERHPTDSSIVLGAPVPPSQQGLWTYTLPLKALENPALLQAILAISSLHIAYLQGAPTTVSLKHYHYALKRIGRAVGLPLRRKQIGTLAATELLAYYEVISADHSKWNSHVAGAAQLIKEIDFVGTTRDLRAYRRKLNQQRRQMGWSNSMMYHHGFGPDPSEDDPFAEKEGSIDQDLIGSLLGRAVNFDEFGRVEDDHGHSARNYFSRKDIENFRIQCDLYWWFTKQDVFHSLISGDKLFMPYYMQCQIPPRAGIGRIDAIYGSADHLWLLLARVTDFGYRDRKRKLRAIRASGTEWKPTPGMFKFMGRFSRGDPSKMKGPPGGGPGGPPPSGPPGGPPSAGAAPPRGSGPPSNSSGGSSGQRAGPPAPNGPPMYGMIPPQGPARLPSGFVDDRRNQRESPEEDEVSDDYTYTEAEHEWEEILVAMDTFAKALGRDFEPLPADVTQAIPTPFGPALQYRTHTIAVIWGFYYASRILLKRLHPSMPPAMMMAAGVAAPTTAEYAQIVGRITGGIYYPQRYNLEAGSLSPTLGSSLTEMTMPIFFAAVQYMDPTQRGWTIAKLRDVSRLTGWKTSDAIASGCEKAWIVAAKHGRGPPYERSFDSSRERANHPMDILERDRKSPTEYSDDRRFVKIEPPDRAYLAMGLLSLEGDMQNLEL